MDKKIKISEYLMNLEKYGCLKYDSDTFHRIVNEIKNIRKTNEVTLQEDELLSEEEISILNQEFLNDIRLALMRAEKIENLVLKRKVLDTIQMLDADFDYPMISAYVGLSEEEIQKIHQEYLPNRYQEKLTTVKKVSE